MRHPQAAARAFLAWHQDPGRDPAVLPRLLKGWESETMHAHGRARATEPETLPAPPPHPGSVPRGTG
ncbi:hypothetical protein ACLVWQ_28335 [Streptomyces sp. CWNU-52B]|uniref:hypothetical protein n=1 Tax=unclassified Streptomyces TaxID=2593676 RepID=UPI0039C2BD3E